MGAKKSLIKYQSELERAERDKLENALTQSKLEIKQLKSELEMERKTALKGETLLESAMTGFLRNVRLSWPRLV